MTKRKPIVSRVQIQLDEFTYFTVASEDGTFSNNLITLGTYPTLAEARSAYREDMNRHHNKTNRNFCYGIMRESNSQEQEE